MVKKMSILRVPTFAIITGASRGIGRAIAIQLARKVDRGSTFFLTARSKEGLEDTAHVIRENTDQNIDIRCIPANFSEPNDVRRFRDDVFESVGNVSRFSHAMIFHNAASLGELNKYIRQLEDVEVVQKYCLLNLTAPILLTAKFLQHFSDAYPKPRKTVAQLTSRSGVLPQKTMHLYGMGKAGRDMFFRVVALEEPEVRVLTFNPGFVDTSMFSDLQGSIDSEFRASRIHLSEQSYFLSPEESANALLQTIEKDEYENGATVLSYDTLNIDITK